MLLAKFLPGSKYASAFDTTDNVSAWMVEVMYFKIKKILVANAESS
jgi:hypothetical protein